MGDPCYYCGFPNEEDSLCSCSSSDVPFSQEDSLYSSSDVSFSEEDSFCSSSNVTFSIPREYATYNNNNNNNPLICRQQDLNAQAAYNVSFQAFMYLHGCVAIIAPTMHPNLVSTLKSLIDIDNNGRNSDHNQASASASAGAGAAAGFGHEEKTAPATQHGHQSQGECSPGDSNSPTC